MKNIQRLSSKLLATFSLFTFLSVSLVSAVNAQTYTNPSATGSNLNSGSNISNQKYPELCSRLTRTLKYGDIGEDVKRLQIVLGQEGVAYLGGTGYYGSLTESAVKTFQRLAGIYPVGKVGPQTLTRMKYLWCSGGSTGPNYDPNTAIDPRLIQSDKISIQPRASTNTGSIIIDWQATGALSCKMNNQDVNIRDTGTYTLTGPSKFQLICLDNQRNVFQRTIIVTPNNTNGGGTGTTNNPVSVSLNISPTSLTVNSYATLNWTSVNANACTLNGQNVSTSGAQQVYVTNTSTIYTINCYGTNNGFATANVTTTGTTGGGQSTGLYMTTATDRTNYNVGDTITINTTITNNSQSTVNYSTNTCNQTQMTINGFTPDSYFSTDPNAYPYTTNCTANAEYINLGPGQSKIYTTTLVAQAYSKNSNTTYASSYRTHSISNSISQLGLSGSATFTVNSGTTVGTNYVNVTPTTITTGNQISISWQYQNPNQQAQGVLFELIDSSGTVVGTIKKFPDFGSGVYQNSGNMSWSIPKSLNNTRIDAINCRTVNGEYLCGNLIPSGQYKVRATYFTPSNACFGFCAPQPGQQTLATLESGYFTVNSSLATGGGNLTPTVSVTPSTATISSGQSVNLNIQVANASYCYLNGGTFANAYYAGNSLNTTVSVSPTTTTTYTANCFNSNGISVTAQSVINVSTFGTADSITIVSNSAKIVTVSVVTSTSSALNRTIDWGDNSYLNYTCTPVNNSCTQTFSHYYATPGTYTVKNLQSYGGALINSVNVTVN